METKDLDRKVKLARTPMELLFSMKDVKEKYDILRQQFEAWMKAFEADAYDANQLLLKHMQLEKDFEKMTKDRDFHQHDAVGLREEIHRLEAKLYDPNSTGAW